MNWYKKAKNNILTAETITISKEDFEQVKEIVKKIMKGKHGWTTEELQLQQNYPSLVEDMLKKHVQISA